MTPRRKDKSRHKFVLDSFRGLLIEKTTIRTFPHEDVTLYNRTQMSKWTGVTVSTVEMTKAPYLHSPGTVQEPWWHPCLHTAVDTTRESYSRLETSYLHSRYHLTLNMSKKIYFIFKSHYSMILIFTSGLFCFFCLKEGAGCFPHPCQLVNSRLKTT